MSNKRTTTAEIVDDLKTCSDMDNASCLFCWRYSSGTSDAHCVGTLMIDAAERLESLQNAMNRLGKFGKLFMDYNGCPRGPMGRMAGVSLVDEALSMPEIVDVDGERWIPVQADVLHELCEQSKSRWISVNERLPNGWIMVDETTNYREPEEYIVFINGAEGPTTAYCIDGEFVPLCTIEGCGTPKCIGYADKVTYWMPMPEPPKEG